MCVNTVKYNRDNNKLVHECWRNVLQRLDRGDVRHFHFIPVGLPAFCIILPCM